MNFFNNLFSGETPELRELTKRRKDIELLQTEVAQKELDIATLRAELHSFRVTYYRQVGDLYRERDSLSAKIALLLAALQADKTTLIDDAVEAAAQAQATEEELNEQANSLNDNLEDKPFQPSTELKAAYRQAAKLMHPDRANNEQDQLYRNEMMAKANVAYERMDLDALVKLVMEFKAEANIGDGIGRELVLMIRQEAKLHERMTEIDCEIEQLALDALMIMRRQVMAAQTEGRDLISDLANKLNDEISTQHTRVTELQNMVDEAELARVTRVVEGCTPTPMDKDRQQASGVHIHRTDRGDFVRSKSELVVSNVFHALDLDYRYEMKITGRHTGGKMLPDFVFINSKDELIVWEHLGMLDKPEYKERWRVKQQWYEDNDFILGVNLFVSRDQADGSLDSQVLRKQALLLRSLL